MHPQRPPNMHRMSDRIRHAGQVAWALAGLTLILVLLGYVAWYVRVIWPPLLLAGIIVFILNPFVTWLQRFRMPRAAGTGIAYIGFIGLFVLGGFLIAPQVRNQWDQFVEEWPEVRGEVETWVDDRAAESRTDDWPVEIPTFQELEDAVTGSNGSSEESEEQLSSEERTERLFTTIDSAREIAVRVFNVGLILIMAPIIAFYLLVDLPHIRRVTESLIPPDRRAEALLLGRRLNKTIGGYFRGQLLIALIVGVLSGLGMSAIGLPFWMVVGVIAGVTNMIPMIGPWIGAVPAVLIALTMEDFTTAIWAVVVLFVVQQVESSWISPIVMQRAVKLHPAVVMLALLAGGSLLGFIGLLLAVPIVAVLKVLLGHLWRTYVLGQPLEAEEEMFEAMDRQPGGVVVDVDRRDEGLDRVTYELDSEGEPVPEGSDRPDAAEGGEDEDEGEGEAVPEGRSEDGDATPMGDAAAR